MTSGKSRLALPLSQVLLLVLGILVIYLGVDFGRQVLVSQQQRNELLGVEAKIAAAQEEGNVLEKRLEEAGSSEAAEEWARSQGMAKPGEVPMIVIGTEVDTQDQVPVRPEKSLGLGSVRQAWWDLFFGAR